MDVGAGLRGCGGGGEKEESDKSLFFIREVHTVLPGMRSSGMAYL